MPQCIYKKEKFDRVSEKEYLPKTKGCDSDWHGPSSNSKFMNDIPDRFVSAYLIEEVGLLA